MLGATEDGLSGPCIFTCPAHGPEEDNEYWKPQPGSYPAIRPVSYSPSVAIQKSTPGAVEPSGVFFFPLRLSEIVDPSRKGWLMDSPNCVVLAMAHRTWREDAEGNLSRQGFTRHYNGGNVLFFDGHVEWIPLTTFTEPENGSLSKTVRNYFDPFTPASD